MNEFHRTNEDQNQVDVLLVFAQGINSQAQESSHKKHGKHIKVVTNSGFNEAQKIAIGAFGFYAKENGSFHAPSECPWLYEAQIVNHLRPIFKIIKSGKEEYALTKFVKQGLSSRYGRISKTNFMKKTDGNGLILYKLSDPVGMIKNMNSISGPFSAEDEYWAEKAKGNGLTKPAQQSIAAGNSTAPPSVSQQQLGVGAQDFVDPSPSHRQGEKVALGLPQKGKKAARHQSDWDSKGDQGTHKKPRLKSPGAETKKTHGTKKLGGSAC